MDYSFRIGLTPRTPLIALFRAEQSWIAWTAVRDQQVAYSMWQGTYLQLFDDGRVTRTTVYDDGTEDVINVKT